MKMKHLTLSYPHLNPNDARDEKSNQLYRVEKVVDTVDYYPGQYLSKGEVDELCRKAAFNVTMLRPKEAAR